jgi:hypothetical protein
VEALEVCFGIASTIAVVYGLERWGRWLSGLYGAPRGLRWVGLIGGLAPPAGTAFTVYGLVRTFGALQGGDAAQKQARLAEGIASAMRGTAIGLGLFALTIVLLLVLTWRFHWSAKEPKASGAPPYR